MTDPGRSGGEGTRWHLDVVMDDVHHADPDCEHDPTCTPVIVLDPVTARDTIARALGEHRERIGVVTAGGNQACGCGWTGRPGLTHDDHVATSLLAALASQERGE